MAEQIFSLKPLGGDFQRISEFLAAIASTNWVAIGDTPVLECYKGDYTGIDGGGPGYSNIQTEVKFESLNVSKDYPVTIRNAPSEYHNGQFGVAMAIWCSIQVNISLRVSTIIEGLEIRNNRSSGTQHAVYIDIDQESGSGNVTIRDNLFTSNGTIGGGSAVNAIYLEDGGVSMPVDIYNNFFWKVRNPAFDNYDDNVSGAIRIKWLGPTRILNNTLNQCQNGISAEITDLIANATIKNNVADVIGTLNKCYRGFNGTETASNNVSSDDTALGAAPIIDTTLDFVDAANGDLHLTASDTEVIGNAENQSGIFTDDIDHEDRGASWDRGSDQYIAAGSTQANALFFAQD